jgi:phosphohistidine phosphatase SixA
LEQKCRFSWISFLFSFLLFWSASDLDGGEGDVEVEALPLEEAQAGIERLHKLGVPVVLVQHVGHQPIVVQHLQRLSIR